MSVPPTRQRLTAPVIAAIITAAAVLSQFVTVGADAMWLVALGDRIRQSGSIPPGVPFLATDTSAWVNVPVLNELVFSVLAGLGSWGLITAQILATATGLLLLALDARRAQASSVMTMVALVVFTLGDFVPLGIVRAQLWSLPFFAGLVLLLRADQQRPGHRIWLLVPLVALWGNLHGAVLIGIAVAGAYLLLSRVRSRPRESVIAGISMIAMLWATPAGPRSHEYYLAVLTSEAPRSGRGLWGPIQLANPGDLLLVVAGATLLIAALSRRIPLWEWVAGAGLLILTAHAARNGLWLLAFLTPRAALAVRPRRGPRQADQPATRRVIVVASGLVVVSVWFGVTGLVRQASAVAATSTETLELSRLIGPSRPTLAPSPLAEWLAAGGVKLWAGNPIEALPRDRQRAYLDFLTLGEASVPGLSPPPDAIVLPRLTHERKLAPYSLLGETTRYSVYVSAKPS